MDFTATPEQYSQELTPEIAETVYALIKEHGNVDLAYKGKTGSAVTLENFIKTDKEADRIISEINLLMSGRKLITPATEDSEAVYYVPTTQFQLEKQLSSEYLTVGTVLTDFMNGLTWLQFKASYAVVEA